MFLPGNMLELSWWENLPDRYPDKRSFLWRVISPTISSASPIMDSHLLSAITHDVGDPRKKAGLSQRKLAEAVGSYYDPATPKALFGDGQPSEEAEPTEQASPSVPPRYQPLF
jgi:hypothetical protein